MKYFSLFSGIGGFEYGIQRSITKDLSEKSNREETDKEARDKEGQCNELFNRNTDRFTCIGFSEIDKYAKQIYKKHFGGHKDYGNCTKIRWEEVEDFDCLVGGFPCQAFSIAGKRGGFSDTRGTLFFEIARCLREKQPRLCVLENVKGLLSHDKGQTFFTILTTLDELGYDVEWQVLNSKNFGVPQNRERVFIIGHSRRTSRPEVFPFREGDKENKGISKVVSTGHDGNTIYSSDGIATTQKALGGGQGGKGGIYDVGTFLDDKATKVRRLTPIECERLQGFPDNWTEGLSDTQRYKTVGNAVTVNVIKEIMKHLII